VPAAEDFICVAAHRIRVQTKTGNGHFEVEIELQLSSTVRLRVRGEVEAPGLREALAMAREAAEEAAGAYASARLQSVSRFPQELIPRLESLTYKELVELLVYFEGPLSRERINQRSRELGREVPRSWLDTEFFRKPYKDLFVAETEPSGVKVYRLSEKGRLEVEEVLRKLGGRF